MRMASVDTSLSRLSSWMSYAAFLGLVALAFLPPRPLPRAATPSATSTPAVGSATSSGQPASSTPAGTPPPPDVWTPAELATGLRKCVELLAPAAVDIVVEEPMKHGQCGTPVPLMLHSAGQSDKVEFVPPPEVNCRLAASLADWVEKVLQPAAHQVLGSRIKRIVGASAYSCRSIYHNPKLPLSEHATGNAVDIAGFVTADGRTIMVAKTWGPTERDIAEARKKAAEKAAAKAGGQDKPATDAHATAPTPSIEEAGKKAAAKEKGHLVKADYKPENEEKPDKSKKAEGPEQSEKPEKAEKSEPMKGAATEAPKATANDAPKAASPEPPKAAPEASPLSPSTTKEATFLKRLHDGSCSVFTTVLGPETNEAHRDHFHLDMKVREGGVSVCH